MLSPVWVFGALQFHGPKCWLCLALTTSDPTTSETGGLLKPGPGDLFSFQSCPCPEVFRNGRKGPGRRGCNAPRVLSSNHPSLQETFFWGDSSLRAPRFGLLLNDLRGVIAGILLSPLSFSYLWLSNLFPGGVR